MADYTVNSAPHPLLADFLLAIHFAWALWIATGVALALVGYRWPRLWRWRAFRITHLIGLLGTATVPIWAKGICPLTAWEWDLRVATTSVAPARAEPFLIHWMRDILFLDVSPIVLSAVTALGAAATLTIFILHPPRKREQRSGGQSPPCQS